MKMDNIIKLPILQVGLAYIFIIIVFIIIRIRGIKREKEIVISSIRMTLQLILTGYILVYILNNPNPYITLGIIILMETFAVFNVMRKFKGRLSTGLKKAIAFSMISGTLLCLIYFLFIVIGIKPWYNPQYFIPLAGMLIGNSMTGISLGVKTLLDGVSSNKAQIEEALILGAKPEMAVKGIINSSFDNAILPTLNSMIGMGIVFLPGMMTGQILSGISPTTAITYQIAIMLGILGSTSITVITMLKLGYRTFINSESQLI
jgi:putative ABC transport system permease protein